MKPILFNTDMVRAILDGRKTVTRRVIKPQPSENAELRYCFAGGRKGDVGKWHDWQQGVMDAQKWTPPFNASDILYVRETWGYDKNNWLYKADFTSADLDRIASITRWLPSIHMPKEAARIFLRVTDVRAERLQDIDMDGFRAEGIWDDYKTTSEKYHDNLCRVAYPLVFAELWNRTIKYKDIHLYGWETNPWVWRIEFERISKEEAERETL